MFHSPVNPPRQPVRAGTFYPDNAPACLIELEEFKHASKVLPVSITGRKIWGGLAPHAGWRYSGLTAWQVFAALQQSNPAPETVFIFATTHRGDVKEPSMQTQGLWETPVGSVAIDEKLAHAFLNAANSPRIPLLDRASAHAEDHAIEVLLPIFKAALPNARMIPIAMPFKADGEKLGALAAQVTVQQKINAAAVASTDLTHYGPNYYEFAPQGVGMAAHRWSKDVNDAAFLQHVLKLEASEAAGTARRDRSACGPAAAAAAIEFSKQSGAREGVLLEHVTSWERGKTEFGEPEDFVGYAGVVFL